MPLVRVETVDILEYLEKICSIYRYPVPCEEGLEELQLRCVPNAFIIDSSEIPLVISFFQSIKIEFNGKDMDALFKLQKGILNTNSEELLIAAVDCGAFPKDNMEVVLQYVKDNELQYAHPILILGYYDAKLVERREDADRN